MSDFRKKLSDFGILNKESYSDGGGLDLKKFFLPEARRTNANYCIALTMLLLTTKE